MVLIISTYLKFAEFQARAFYDNRKCSQIRTVSKY